MILSDDVLMRTTLSLDPDVAERVRQEMKRSGHGLKRVINEALRLGLGLAGKRRRPAPFAVQAHSFGFRPGFDLDRLNQLVDELEVAEQARTLGQ
jgi:hypothetical protein